MTKFVSHGTFEAHLKDKVIVFKATGPWNLETMNDTVEDFAQLSASLYGSPWGLVGDFYGQPVHVPDAAQKLIEIIKLEKAKGRIATGIVVKNCDMPLLGQQHLSEVYSKAGERFQVFDIVEDAIAWVESEIQGAR